MFFMPQYLWGLMPNKVAEPSTARNVAADRFQHTVDALTKGSALSTETLEPKHAQAQQ